MFIHGGYWSRGPGGLFGSGGLSDCLGCLVAPRQQELQGARLECCLQGCSAAHVSLLPGPVSAAVVQIAKKGRTQMLQVG